MNLLRRVEIGDKAKALLENELLNKYWEDVEKTLFQRIGETDFKDTGRLQELKALLDAYQSMKKDFTRYVADGKRASSQLGKKKLFK